MQIALRKITGIQPYEKNPRQNDSAVDAVAASIREFGFRQPIVVDENGVIVAGHTRYKAALKLGLEKVPVHVAKGLTQDQVKAYRLADNKTGELAEWDYDLLPLELADLHGAGFDLSLLGFSDDDLARLIDCDITAGLIDPDDIPEPPDAATTQPGDLWTLGKHRLLCGDSSNPKDVDRLLGGVEIHLINTDPPYNVNVEPRSNNAIAAGLSSSQGAAHHQKFDAARRPKSSKRTTKKLRAKDRPLINDFVSDEEFDKLLAAWFGNMARVLVPGRTFYIWGGYANCINYPPQMKAAGLYFSQAIIWIKEHPVLTRKDFMGNHEWCFYGWREGAAHQFFGRANVPDTWRLSRAVRGNCQIGNGVRLGWADGTRLDVLPPGKDKRREVSVDDEVTLVGMSDVSDVWSVKKINPQSMIHLTEKPVELAIRAIQYSSRTGENVLDLFGGSGSTLIACEQTDRQAYLMELDQLYCDVIVQRFEQFTGQKAKRRRKR